MNSLVFNAHRKINLCVKQKQAVNSDKIDILVLLSTSYVCKSLNLLVVQMFISWN